MGTPNEEFQICSRNKKEPGRYVPFIFLLYSWGSLFGDPSRTLLAFSLSSLNPTLPETNMETQKEPYKDYSPSKRGLYGFPC